MKQITLAKIKRRICAVILETDNFILRIVGYIPSHFIRRFFYRLSGIQIGKGSAIHMGAVFYNPSNIFIGEDTIIGEGAVLDGRDSITIGNHVAFASEVMVYNAEHNIHSKDFEAIRAPVSIEDYVFVGPRAIILPGVTIGKGAVVGAGAVVTKDVEPHCVVGGVPAKKITTRNATDFTYKLGRASWFR